MACHYPFDVGWCKEVCGEIVPAFISAHMQRLFRCIYGNQDAMDDFVKKRRAIAVRRRLTVSESRQRLPAVGLLAAYLQPWLYP